MLRTAPTRTRPPTTYAGLIASFPLRPLHDEADYENALEAARLLVGLAEPTPDQADYLDVLVDIIQKYEATHHTIGARKPRPLTVLKRILADQGMTASDLGRLLGNRQLGPLIVRGERQLSKAHIRALADHFKISTDALLE